MLIVSGCVLTSWTALAADDKQLETWRDEALRLARSSVPEEVGWRSPTIDELAGLFSAVRPEKPANARLLGVVKTLGRVPTEEEIELDIQMNKRGLPRTQQAPSDAELRAWVVNQFTQTKVRPRQEWFWGGHYRVDTMFGGRPVEPVDEVLRGSLPFDSSEIVSNRADGTFIGSYGLNPILRSATIRTNNAMIERPYLIQAIVGDPTFETHISIAMGAVITNYGSPRPPLIVFDAAKANRLIQGESRFGGVKVRSCEFLGKPALQFLIQLPSVPPSGSAGRITLVCSAASMRQVLLMHSVTENEERLFLRRSFDEHGVATEFLDRVTRKSGRTYESLVNLVEVDLAGDFDPSVEFAFSPPEDYLVVARTMNGQSAVISGPGDSVLNISHHRSSNSTWARVVIWIVLVLAGVSAICLIKRFNR